MLAQVKGRHSFALVLMRFTDIPTLPNPMSDFQDLVAANAPGTLDDFWRHVTYQQLDIGSSKVFGWFTMKYAFADLYDPAKAITLNHRSLWIDQARYLLNASGVDLAPFHGVIAVVNGAGDGGALSGGVDYALPIMGAWGEDRWKWCKKCQVLAFAGHPSAGPCPAGGVHDHGASGNYHLAREMPSFPGQHQWRWCKKCEGLAYGPGVASVCAAGGAHDLSASGDYGLAKWPIAQVPAPFGGQPGWRWCGKCGLLAFSANAPSVCKAGGAHDLSASDDYTLTADASSLTMYFAAHEMGHCFGMLHSWAKGTPDLEYGDPLDLMGFPTNGFPVPVYGTAGPGLNAPTLFRQGWLPPNRVWTMGLGFSGAYQVPLAAVNHPEQSGHLLARVVSPDRIHTVELRHPSGWDQGMGQARVFVHELRSLFTAGQNGWRWCAKCQVLNFAGAAACPSGGAHDLAESGDYALRFAGPGVPGQPGWRWCLKCQGLAFNGAGSSGVCAAGGSHDFSGSGNYALRNNDPAAPGQGGWRWCKKCEGLWFRDGTRPRVCPAGDIHDSAGSGDYRVAFGPAPSGSQDHWRWCRKCQGLWFAGGARCAGAPAHDNSQSSDYSLISEAPGAPGQAAWKWCRKCQGLGFSAHATPGTCPAGGVHDYSQSGNYRVLLNAAGAVGQNQWRWCAKCEGLTYGGAGTAPCPTNGVHDQSGSGDYTLVRSFEDLTYSLVFTGLVGAKFQDPAYGITVTVDTIAASGQQASLTINRA